MAARSKIKSKTKVPIKKEHFEVVLENMNDSIKLIAEGQISFRQEVNQRFDESNSRFVEFRDEMNGFRKEMYGFRDETQANFKTVFEYLVKIDDELQDIKKNLKRLDETKIDKTEFAALAQRVAKLEIELEKYKTAAVVKK